MFLSSYRSTSFSACFLAGCFLKPFKLAYTVGFRLGEVLDPDTKLYMVLYGDRGESGRIYLSPDGSKFEPDKFYKVSVNIKDIGNVSYSYH